MRFRDHAYCGIFGALALALPALFHVFGPVGPLLLPVYWPLVTLAFLVRTRAAVTLAFVVPWVSAFLTGMPLLWPPLAGVLSVELALQIGALGALRRWIDRSSRRDAGVGRRVFWALLSVLVPGRVLHAGLLWGMACCFDCPPGPLAHFRGSLGWSEILAGLGLLSGWPGVMLMLIFVPVFIGAVVRRDGVCEVGFLKAMRRLHLPESLVLVTAQVLRWFEALARDAEFLARALELRHASAHPPRTGTVPTPTGTVPKGEVLETVIRCKNLRVRYPQAEGWALNMDDFELLAGERVAILGRNGCGKTTFLSLLCGYMKYEGLVEVFGMPLAAKSVRIIRSKMGVLFDNPDNQFIYPTLYEDIAYGMERRPTIGLRGTGPVGVGTDPMRMGTDPVSVGTGPVKERVERCLEAVGLPLGNRPVATLSRGQRQRAALAGVLAAEPELILLDEPTAALDDVEKERLARCLQNCPAAVLIASHDQAFVSKVCTRVLSLS